MNRIPSASFLKRKHSTKRNYNRQMMRNTKTTTFMKGNRYKNVSKSQTANACGSQQGLGNRTTALYTVACTRGKSNALGEALGIELELEAQEINVGDFRADILCKNTEDNSWVLIENQLEANRP